MEESQQKAKFIFFVDKQLRPKFKTIIELFVEKSRFVLLYIDLILICFWKNVIFRPWQIYDFVFNGRTRICF